MNKKIICLTPVKNEAWILETFLKTTSLWADHIIIADQGSTDDSPSIAQKFDKVVLVNNDKSNYNELNRQKLLINYARRNFGTNNILIALDADEILVNYNDNPDWEKIKTLDEGTAFYFPWLNVLPGNKTFFPSVGGKQLFGYIDDGREHVGTEMHSPRVPIHSDTKALYFDSIKVLHYQFAVRERQLSKHRWYECLEKIKYPQKDSINLYRMYHHIDLPILNKYEIPESWYRHQDENGIDITSIKDDGFHWWDKEVCEFFQKHGVAYFKKQYIWYKDWEKINKSFFPMSPHEIYDPRSLFDKLVHAWLQKSQQSPNSYFNRKVDRLIRIFKW